MKSLFPTLLHEFTIPDFAAERDSLIEYCYKFLSKLKYPSYVPYFNMELKQILNLGKLEIFINFGKLEIFQDSSVFLNFLEINLIQNFYTICC